MTVQFTSFPASDRFPSLIRVSIVCDRFRDSSVTFDLVLEPKPEYEFVIVTIEILSK